MNPMQMLSNMMGGNGMTPLQLMNMLKCGQINPQHLIGMFGNDSRMAQAHKTLQSV